MDKFKNKHRVPSARLSSWNYAWAGAYFVTLCTKNRECHFGEVEDEAMHLNAFGQRAAQCWNAIPEHFPFVTLGAWVIMPNHVHGIIIINPAVETQDVSGKKETQDVASLRATQNTFGPQSGNLASVVRGFKIGVTKSAKELNENFSWQPRFHDHIIRNHKSFNRIVEYIENNPKNWTQDELYNHRNNPTP